MSDESAERAGYVRGGTDRAKAVAARYVADFPIGRDMGNWRVTKGPHMVERYGKNTTCIAIRCRVHLEVESVRPLSGFANSGAVMCKKCSLVAAKKRFNYRMPPKRPEP
jgi:hypothetical protein